MLNRVVKQERVPTAPVCTENLDPDVVVMKSAKDRVGIVRQIYVA